MHKLQVQQLHQKTEILKQEIYSVNAMQLLCPTTTKQLFWATSEEWKLRKRRILNQKYYKTGNLISCCVPLDGDIIGVIRITETFCLEFSLIVLLKVGKWKQKSRNKKLNPLWMETVLGSFGSQKNNFWIWLYIFIRPIINFKISCTENFWTNMICCSIPLWLWTVRSLKDLTCFSAFQSPPPPTHSPRA